MILTNANEKKYSYPEDKNGWVTFKGTKKKVKLRKWIADYARKMTKWGLKYSFCRDFLISYYEMDSINGVVRAYSLASIEHLNDLKKKQEDVRKKINPSMDKNNEKT